MVSTDSKHNDTDRDRKARQITKDHGRKAPYIMTDSKTNLQILTDPVRWVPANKFLRVSHFNPTGITLTAFHKSDRRENLKKQC